MRRSPRWAALARSPAPAAITVSELNQDHGEEDGTSLDRLVRGLTAALAAAPSIRRTHAA
jgi:hypothetical protein